MDGNDDVIAGGGLTDVPTGSIRWAVATRIVYAWIFTIPAAGMVGAAGVVLAQLAGAL